MESEDPLQKKKKKKKKGHIFQEGSSGTHFDYSQFEIKTFSIYARPSLQSFWQRSHILVFLFHISFVPRVSVKVGHVVYI